MDPQLRTDWDALADVLGNGTLDILREAPVTVSEQRWRDPRVIAIMLAARSLSNFRGVFALVDLGLIVEARILVRSLFEDAFWMAALAVAGADFVSEMLKDDARSTKLRGEFVLRASSEGDETVQHIRDRLQSIQDRWPAAKLLNPKSVAESGPLKDFYVVYTQLSADAAHPTLSALSRYLVPASNGGDDVIEVVPAMRDAELANTLDWACSAMLNASAGLNDILGCTKGPALNAIAERYAVLTRTSRERYAGKWSSQPVS